MIITDYVEAKIRKSLQMFPSTEWSGILFYKYEGTIDDKNLVITCEDILPMNIGVGGYTQFEEDASIIGYMVDNDLMDCEYGLIHSHHHMQTFFSGEDKNTLMMDGADRNNFVSLIVNHAGTYTAKITSKEHCKAKISKFLTIPFFGIDKHREETDEKESIKVTYYDLKITIGKTQFDLSDLESRFEELKSTAGVFDVNERSAWNNKDKGTKASKSIVDDIIADNTGSSFGKFGIQSLKEAKQLTLDLEDDSNDFEPIIIDENIIEAATAQLVSGLLTAVRMPNNLPNIAARFNSRFINDKEMEFVVGNHVTNVIESMIEHIEDPSIPDDIKMTNLAAACYEKIDSLAMEDEYPYIKETLECLVAYANN